MEDAITALLWLTTGMLGLWVATGLTVLMVIRVNIWRKL
jgi:hypothetical protein